MDNWVGAGGVGRGGMGWDGVGAGINIPNVFLFPYVT